MASDNLPDGRRAQGPRVFAGLSLSPKSSEQVLLTCLVSEGAQAKQEASGVTQRREERMWQSGCPEGAPLGLQTYW
jgi:hypothetical protein